MRAPDALDHLAESVNRADPEQRDAPPDVRLCDCGHEDAYWLTIRGRTYCEGCLRRMGDEEAA